MTVCRFCLVLSLTSMLAVLPSCSSPPKGSMSQSELKKVQASAQTVHPGMSKQTVMDKYKGANMVRLSSATLDGANIEEWKAEAFSDTNKGRDLSVQFLYFRNSVLVDMSDTRIDFRNDAALTKRWADQKAD